MERVHVVIRGRVQGVGFRYFVVRRARDLGLTGWVRNRADGAVEADAEGPRPALEALIDAVRRGPTSARVEDVREEWSEATAAYRNFAVTG